MQHFAEDDVRQGETLPIQFLIQPVGLSILRALQLVDPDGRVDDDH